MSRTGQGETTAMKRIRALSVRAIGVTATLIGCQDPAIQRRFDRREDSFHRTTALLASLEADRARQIQTTLGFLAGQHQRDIANCQRNGPAVRQWLADDVERWKDNQPIHRQRIADQLAGDPANIERRIPDIVE